MEKGKLHNIISNYLPKNEQFRLSSARYSNLLYKIEPDESQPLVLKLFNEESRFIREKVAYKTLITKAVKIPNLVDTGEEDSIYWIIYEFVEGERLSNLNIDNTNNSNILFYEIGYNLGKAHACDSSFFFPKKEKGIYIKKRKKAFERGARNYNKRLVEKYPGYSKIFEMANNFTEQYDNLLFDEEDFNFIIGDFSANNIIINNGALAAFIDFEYFMLENRYRDFILMYYFFEHDEQTKVSFLNGYSESMGDDNFEFLSDKLMIFLLHYRLECCIVANHKTIDWDIKKLKDIVLNHDKKIQ